MGYTLDPAEVPPYASPEAWARFCAKTVVTTSDVIWVGALSKGYGTFTDGGFRDLDLELPNHGATVTATRWLLTAHHGAIARGQKAMHRCDLPICVNIECLVLGSQKQNIQDAASRDRLARRRGPVRLDKADVRGLAAQSRAIRFAVLEAVDAGVTDPGLLDLVVASAVAEGDPDSVSVKVPLFPMEVIQIGERRSQRHPAACLGTAA